MDGISLPTVDNSDDNLLTFRLIVLMRSVFSDILVNFSSKPATKCAIFLIASMSDDVIDETVDVDF